MEVNHRHQFSQIGATMSFQRDQRIGASDGPEQIEYLLMFFAFDKPGQDGCSAMREPSLEGIHERPHSSNIVTDIQYQCRTTFANQCLEASRPFDVT